MEFMMGLLRITVIRGMNLVVKDFTSSDPYVVITMKEQKVRTEHVNHTCNPYWNEALTFAVFDLETPINLTVYDKDIFKQDDFMGEARIDIIPYLEYLKAGLEPFSGSVVDTVDPTKENCLNETSYFVWKENGKLVQNMILRLNKVPSGEVEIQVEWIDVPGARSLTS